MKPVKRKIRKHFGVTAKQVAVRSQRPWYFVWLMAMLVFAVGYLLAYWQFTGGETNLTKKLHQVIFLNQNMQTKTIQLERQLQIERAAQSNLEKELDLIQEQNMKIKEDLLFYKNMVKKK